MTEIIERKPWQRRQDESAKAFHAFIIYRDMLPKERSLEKVRERLGKGRGYYPLLERWSSRHRWGERSLAHDDYLDEVRAESQVHAVKEMAERQAKEGLALQKIGIEYLTEKGINKSRDAIRAVAEGAKLERLARGEPSEIVKGTFTIKPIEQWTNEELDKYLAEGEMPE